MAELVWDLAERPSGGQSTILFVDGFGSASDEEHVACHHRHRLRGRHVSAFSYNGVGKPYSARDSYYVRAAVSIFPDFLPQHHTRLVIPVGASGGAAVALLGTAQWVREMNVDADVLKATVPMLILVSPPFGLDTDRFREAFGIDVAAEKTAFPADVIDLAGGSAEALRQWELDFAEAAGVLRWADIGIRVVEWPADLLTRQRWTPGLERAVTPCARESVNVTQRVRRDDDPRSSRQALVSHLKFLRHEKVARYIKEWSDLVWR